MFKNFTYSQLEVLYAALTEKMFNMKQTGSEDSPEQRAAGRMVSSILKEIASRR